MQKMLIASLYIEYKLPLHNIKSFSQSLTFQSDRQIFSYLRKSATMNVWTFLLLVGLAAHSFAAPSSENLNAAVEGAENLADSTGPIVAAEENVDDNIRAKKSPSPKTICYQMQDHQGTSYLQCGDQDSSASSSYPSYSPAPSYSAPQMPSYSAPSYSAPQAPSYSAPPSYSASSYSAPKPYSQPSHSYSAPSHSYSPPSYSAPSYKVITFFFSYILFSIAQCQN